MSDLVNYYGVTPNATISSSVTPAVNCKGASGVLVHILTTSSLTFTAQVCLDAGATSPDYTTVPITNFKTGVTTAAGSAVTPSADDLYFIPTGGAPKLQLVSGAGSGTLSAAPIFAHNLLSAVNPATTSLGVLDDIVGQEYETVAASQTAQVLGATGATGDLLNGVLIIPATTSPGNVLLLDNATSITIFAGGASSVLTLHPFLVPLGIRSVSGAWKITTGANVSCIGFGDFT